MDFVGVAVRSQGVDVRIGDLDLIGLFAGDVGWQAALPEMVFPFNFAFGLRRWGIAQADVVEFERPAQLGEGLVLVGEEETVVIDIEFQGPAMGQKGGGQEVEVGQQEFALVEFGAGKQATTVVEHVQHGKGEVDGGEPAMRRGVQLPEFTNAGALPTVYRGQNSFGWNRVSQLVFQRPTAHLGSVELEGVKPEHLGSGKAVGAWRRTAQSLAQEFHDRLGPG